MWSRQVINPTKAVGGNKLKDICRESFKASNSSPSIQVSTKNMNTGGIQGARARNFYWSSYVKANEAAKIDPNIGDRACQLFGQLEGLASLYGLPPTVGYENHDVRKQRLPKYSFGVKTEQKLTQLGPGPAIYNVEKLVRYGASKANHFTIAPKTKIIEKAKSPGPQAYAVHKYPILKGSRAPAYSMGKVLTFEFKKFAPGPNKYGIKDNFLRLRAPAYTLGVKKYLPEKKISPGPAGFPATDLNLVKPQSPKYTITPNNKFIHKLYGPGSNFYNRMNYKPGKRAPIYSFGIRHHSKSPPMIVPCDNI
uniref:Uncharacterized protein n=1 Tax=Glossina austeni TaxID=7395 RepID=A0A1A9UN64_GLOAU